MLHHTLSDMRLLWVALGMLILTACGDKGDGDTAQEAERSAPEVAVETRAALQDRMRNRANPKTKALRFARLILSVKAA